MQNYIKEIVPKYVGKKHKQFKISDAKDVTKFLNSIVIDENKEHFIALYLNGNHEIITYSIVSIGLLNSTQVHAREVFKNAVLTASCSVIVAHNHPSGNLNPSDADLKVTDSLSSAGKILGIKLLDHIIFTKNKTHYSFQEHGKM